MPEIKRWAPDEQAAYMKGPGFEVRYTKGRSVPISDPGPIVRRGNRRYYFGASGAIQL